MSEAVDSWGDIAPWWQREATTDPVYREDIEPIVDRLVPPDPGTVIELGCGEGQWLRRFARRSLQAYGCDRSMTLLTDAAVDAPVVCASLPDLSWLRNDSIDVAVSIFVLDLIADAATFFAETARVVREDGSLIVVINHPGFTAPGSGPLVDVDGEVLWRWGRYLEDGSSTHPAGAGQVLFHHRPLGRLLTLAAESGWSLEAIAEAALGAAAIEREPGYAGQEGIPRFLGARWGRSSD